MTVRVRAGEAAHWTGVGRIWIGGSRRGGRLYHVERSRAYRDRLVLKLRGVDDPNAAESLRGCEVAVPEEEAPALPSGAHYVAKLVGLEVYDEAGERLGRVRDVMPTGGTDVLIVDVPGGTDGEDELMIPLARSIVLEIAEGEGCIRVRLPEGLADLNRAEGGDV